MHRRSIHVHGLSHFNSSQMLVCYLSGFSIRFQKLSRAHGQVTYVLLTRSPLDSEKQAFLPLVRLACIRHAASVNPEPGSNSHISFILAPPVMFSFQRSIFFLRRLTHLLYYTKFYSFCQEFDTFFCKIFISAKFNKRFLINSIVLQLKTLYIISNFYYCV